MGTACAQGAPCRADALQAEPVFVRLTSGRVALTGVWVNKQPVELLVHKELSWMSLALT